MTKRIFGLLLLFALPQVGGAVEFNQLVANKSALTFKYTQMGVPMDGKFGKFAANLVFDPTNLARSRALLDVDLASIDTGSTEGDEEVVGKLWFNAAAYPTAKFVSTGVKALGGNRFEVSGNMTIKGRTKAVTAPFTFFQQGALGVLDGAFILKRLDFAIGEGIWTDVSAVANEIQIKFHFVTSTKK